MEVTVPNQLLADIGVNEVVIQAVTPSYQGLGGGISEPYFGSIRKHLAHTLSAVRQFLSRTVVRGFIHHEFRRPYSAILLVSISKLSASVITSLLTVISLSVTRSGINTFIIRDDLNPRYAALNVQSQFYVDIKVSSVANDSLFDIQRCVIVTVIPEDIDTSTAVGQNTRGDTP